MIKSHALIFSDFETEWYKHWAKELKQNKANLEAYKLRANKFWQNAVMAQALSEHDMLRKGTACIGFGVGKERLPALFAKSGVKVTATDQDFTTEKAKHWQEHELATGTQSLNKLGICNPKKFHENVSYESVDMTNIPKKFHDKYDFLWSNCALGHLGSIEAGIDFIVASTKCLKPGGYAVHTTEVNVISDNETVDNNKDTVIFRPRDIRHLATRLRAEGLELSPLELNFGTTPDDQKISISPEFGNDYSKLQVGGHIITQVVLVIKKHAKISPLKKQSLKQQQEFAYRKNLIQQRKFASSNKFLKSIRAYEKTLLGENFISPKKNNLSVKLAGKPKDIYIEYENISDQPLFGMHERLHSTKPLALATSNPQDRLSKFVANDWYNNQANRPSIALCIKDEADKWKNADYIRPHTTFAYRLKLDPSKLKKGLYEESFMVVQEGVAYLSDSEVTVTVTVT